MSFTALQNEQLAAKLDAGHVKEREQAGRKFSYIEGWLAIAEANRIFGHDSWTRETVEIRCVSERPRKVGKGQYERDGWGVSYVARVRVVVFAGDTLVTREGVGAGHGIDADCGLAHESAIKEAETDAMKRALMTFGNPFGLALYDKTQEGVEKTPPAARAAPPVRSAPAPVSTTATIGNGVQAAIARIREHKTKPELLNWFKSVKPRIDKFSPDDQAEFYIRYDAAVADFVQADLTMAG